QNKTTLEVTRYSYTSEDQLSKVEILPNPGAPPTMTVEFEYDVMGRRITKSANGDIKKFAYDGEDIIYETDGTHRWTSFMLHGPGIDEPLQVSDIDPSHDRCWDAIERMLPI
ncbi:MAG: hypothetical protein HYU64_19065, partial [Armatimonadetes bacterium]|nr:hypothetical protein [Armatimonadota bacterium]